MGRLVITSIIAEPTKKGLPEGWSFLPHSGEPPTALVQGKARVSPA